MNNQIRPGDVIKGVFSSYAPATINTIDSTAQATKDVIAVGRQINVKMRRNMTQIDKSQPGRRAIALFKAAKETLASGEYEIEQYNEELYNDYDEYEEDFTTENMTDDERANTSPEEVILRGNRGIARTVVRSTNAQLSAMSASSRNLLKGTLRGLEATSKEITNSIIYSTNVMSAQMSAANYKLDTINKNLVSMISYQNENTTKFYETNLELMNTMISGMKNLEKNSRGSELRSLDNYDVSSGFNIKEYAQRVKKGIKNSTLVSGANMLQTMTGMASSGVMSQGEMIGTMLGSFLPMIPSSKTLPGLKHLTKLSNVDKAFKSRLDEMLYSIGDKLANNSIAMLLGLDSLGNKRRNISGMSMGNYMKDQLPWNGKAQKALTEVIPELLTSIDAGINNHSKRYFDYEQGTWKSREELEKNMAEEISNNISLEFSTLMNNLSRRLDNSGKSQDEINATKSKMNNIITDRVYGQGDIQAAKQEMTTLLESMNLSSAEFSGAFGSIEKSINAVSESIAKFYREIETTDSVYRNLNNKSGATASDTTSREYHRTLKDNRHNFKVFESSFTQDIDDTLNYIEMMVTQKYPDFIMTREYKEAIIAEIRKGKDDFEILRLVMNSVGRGSFAEKVTGKVGEFFGKGWAKIRGKQYVPAQIPPITNPDEDDIFYDLGDTGNYLNYKALERIHGIHTNYYSDSAPVIPGPIRHAESAAYRTRDTINNTRDNRRNRRVETTQGSGNAAGAASSRGSNDAGIVAGAGTTARDRSSGRSSTPPISNADQNVLDDIIDAASIINPEDMTSNDDVRAQRAIDAGAELITDMIDNPASTVEGAVANLANASVVSMGSMIGSFNTFTNKLFGKDGLIANFFKSETFKNGINKLKSYLFDEEKGILRKPAAAVKNWGKDVWSKTKEKLLDAYDWTYDKYAIYKYGEDYRNKDEWKNSELMQKFDLNARHLEKVKAANAEELETESGDKLVKDKNGKWRYAKGSANSKGGKFAEAEVVEAAKKNSEKKSSILALPAPSDDVEHKSSTPKITANETLKESTQKIEKAEEELKESVEKASSDVPMVLKESTQKLAEVGTESAEKMQKATDAQIEAIVGDPKESPDKLKDKMSKSFSNISKKVLPKIGVGAIIGAGVGMLNGFGGASVLGSLFLPTGLIGGAIVGGGLTLLSQTEAFKSLMFGKMGEDGERSGGLISKNLKESFKKAAPFAVGGAVAGALKSVIMAPLIGGGGLGVLGMQLLPGGILGGAILGAGVGLLKNSETFKSLLFGKKDEDGKRTGTILSKSFNKFKDKFTGSADYLKNGLKGLGIGAVSAVTLSHMGALPAALASGGPIGLGIAGFGLGIASSTKKFNEMLFGVEEFDDNGKSLGRKGGIIGRVKNLISANVVEPISLAFKSTMSDLIFWAKDKITYPFRAAFGPILSSIEGIKDNVVEFTKDKFEKIGEGITSMIKNSLKALFSPITRLLGFVGKGIMGGAKLSIQMAALPLTGGLQLMNMMTAGMRGKEYSKFYKNYYAKGNIKNNLQEYWKAKQDDYDKQAAETGKRAKKVGFLDKISDTIGAYTGHGEFAVAAREGYNEAETDAGNNVLNWRNVFREKRENKQKHKKEKDAFKQWNDIGKLSRSIANKDLGGREIQLTKKRFDFYKKQFVKKGVDGSLINTNEDLMDLIYRTGQFRKRAAGDSGESPILQALKDYRISDEERQAMEETKQYQTNVLSFLGSLKDMFEKIGEDQVYKDKGESFLDKRKTHKKKLQDKLRRVYKTDSWKNSNAKKIDLDDPIYREFDLQDISKEDLEDYAFSNFATNNDFAGYLESLGKRFSEDDIRLHYLNGTRMSPKKSEDKKGTSEGKSSEQPIEKNDSKSSDNSSSVEKVLAGMSDSMKRQADITEAEFTANAGGESEADKLLKKGKSNSIDKKAANKFSLGGIIGNIFHRKKKDEKDAARAAREAAESAHATALGDEKPEDEESEKGADINVHVAEEKEQGFFGKLFGGIKSGFSWFGSTKVGKVAKTIAKYGIIPALPPLFALSLLDIIKPGSTEAIGAKLDQFNESVEDGTFYDTVKNRITTGLDWVEEKVKSFFDKTALGQAMSNVGASIVEHAPKMLENTINLLPKILPTLATTLANSAELLVTSAVNVMTIIGPPLMTAMIKTLPKVAWELGIKLPLEVGKELGKSLVTSICRLLGVKSPFKEKSETKTGLSLDDAQDSGKNYQEDNTTPKEYVTAEEAEKIKQRGGVIKEDNQGLYEQKYIVTGSNTLGFDENSNEIVQRNSDIRRSAEKLGLQALVQSVTGRTEIAKGANLLTKLVKPGQAVLSGSGKIAGTLGEGVGYATKIPLVGKLFKPTEWVLKAYEGMLNTAAHPVQTIIGTADNPSIIAKANNGIKGIISKITGKSAAIANDAANAAADATPSILSKLSKSISELKNNKTLLGILDKFKSVIGKECKPLEWICNFLDDIIKKIISKCNGKIAPSILGRFSSALAKAGATSLPYITVVSAAWGVGTGALEAEKLFHVDKADGFMIAISAILKGLLSISFGCIFDLLFEIASELFDIDIKQQIAIGLYRVLTLFSDEKYDELLNSQETQNIEREVYNTLNDLNLDESAYNKLDNKGVLSSLWTGAKNGFYKLTGQSEKVNEGTKNSSEIVKVLISKGYTAEDISKMSKNEIISAASDKGRSSSGSSYGPGPNSVVGYGSSPLSQGFGAWANMPIGRFANGQVSTMRTGGCGPTALATVSNLMNGAISPATVGAYAARNGYIVNGGASSDLFTKGASALGLKSSKVGRSRLKSELQAGRPTVISGRSTGPFTDAGHVVVATGTDNNGNIRVIDPTDGNAHVYRSSDITSGMTNAWSYENINVGYGPSRINRAYTNIRNARNTITVNTTRNRAAEQEKVKNDAKIQSLYGSGLEVLSTSLHSIPDIMYNILHSSLNPVAENVFNAVSIPIKYALNGIRVLSNAILGYTDSDTNISDSTTLTSNMKNDFSKIRGTVVKGGVITRILNGAKTVGAAYKEAFKTVASKASKATSKAWNALTGKSSSYGELSYDVGMPVGYGPTFNKSLSNPKVNTNKNIDKSTIITKFNSKSLRDKYANAVKKQVLGHTTIHKIYNDIWKSYKASNPGESVGDYIKYTNSWWRSNALVPVPVCEPGDPAYQAYINYVNSNQYTSAKVISKDNKMIKPEPTKVLPSASISTKSISTDNSSVEVTTDNAGFSETVVDHIPSLKDLFSSATTNIGGFFKKLSAIGDVLRASLGVIKGEGTFEEVYNSIKNGTYEASENSTISSEDGSITLSSENATGSSVYIQRSGTEVMGDNTNVDTRQKRVWQALRSRGFNEIASSGILGVWKGESAVTPYRIEGDHTKRAKRAVSDGGFGGIDNILSSRKNLNAYGYWLTHTAMDPSKLSLKTYYPEGNIGPNGNCYPGIGLAQWTGTRAKRLLATYSGNRDWRDPKVQMAFMDTEMKESYKIDGKPMKEYLNTLSNPVDVAIAFNKRYEGITCSDTKKQFANDMYAKYKGIYGLGPNGEIVYGPTNWSEWNSGFNSAMSTLDSRLAEMGILDFIKPSYNSADDSGVTTTATGNYTSPSYDPSKWGTGYMAPVNAMKSIQGKLAYSQDGNKQDPDKGVASCASTVAWAYKKAIGVRPGDTVSSSAYMRSQEQAKDTNFQTIWENKGTPVSDADIARMQPGDIIYTNWKRTSNNGQLSHTEMYIGNGQILSHGGGTGPQLKQLNDYRRKHTMLIRRYKGFMNAGNGPGPDASDNISINSSKLVSDFQREINSKDGDNLHNIKLGREGGSGNTTISGGTASNNNSDIATRLDKILTVIGEWYLYSKEHEPQNQPTNIVGPTTNNVNNITNNQAKDPNPAMNLNIQKLSQRHQAFARMYN